MKSKLALIILTILILNSCADDNIVSNQNFELTASEWFDENTDSYIWENKKARINWSKTSLVTDANNKQYLIIPFKDYKTFENSDYVFSRNIILSYENGEVIHGRIIDLLSDSEEYLMLNENKALLGTLQNDFSLSQIEVFIYDLNFNQERSEPKSNARTNSELSIRKETSTTLDNGRTADYMCTHYYYGSNTSGWEYLG